ncbi:hypothetical protein QVD17_14475 [Tagetes erecta]|uniref:Uncharacterized protein n=1 Tax=Tagetes erecta TaxID=13708 RepID=A0AAD8L1P2_TARER|nr:hypothetical protein QVD17_14475 [Tagetes erecta]
MSMVNLWMKEVTKLTDKIHLKKKNQHLFLKSQTTTTKTKTETDDQIEEHEDLALNLTVTAKPASVLLKSPATENDWSEETVFWLMDRFAPC